MEERSYYPISNNNNSIVMSSSALPAPGATRYLRAIPPAHYKLKVESFSLLTETFSRCGMEKYESGCFEAGGYLWRLSLYPDGDKKRNGNGYISLYLVMVDTDTLPANLDVNVNFRLFIYDQIRDKYLTIEDANGMVRRFHKMRTEYGFAQLIPLSVFNNASSGFLIDDSCVFGAEVFIIKKSHKGESASMIKKPNDHHFTWTISGFSKLSKEFYQSQVFKAGGRQWMLELYPKGHGLCKGLNYLSLFLLLVDGKNNPTAKRWLLGTRDAEGKNVEANIPSEELYVEFTLLAKNQVPGGRHHELPLNQWFSTRKTCWGCGDFLTLLVLTDESDGFVVNDTLIVEVNVNVIFEVKNFF